MSTEELLKPRYQVIADYPGNLFNVGDILHVYKTVDECEAHKGNGIAALNDYGQWDKYPHLFKKLAWYEKRELSDMPEYVKVVNPNSLWEDTPPGCIRYVAEWKFNDNNKLVCDLFPLMVNNIQLYRLEPATQQDYYLNTQTK